MLSLKTGVLIEGLCVEMALGAMIVHSVFQHYGFDTVITSVKDGNHMPGSLHPSGRACDFRTRHIPPGKLDEIIDTVNSALSSEFDVVKESNHLHVEYDVKR